MAMGGQARVLVCDHDSQTVRALRAVLRDAAFEVDVTSSSEQALDRAALRTPDAVITELLLSDGDGAELCRRLRDWSAMPLIVLSAVDDEEQKVRALEAGADDYVMKPFAARELVARLRATIRRSEPDGSGQPSVEFGGLEIDFAARLVRLRGQEVHLTPTEFRLLRVLVRNRGRPLTHHALLQQVWGRAYLEDRQILRVHIANLRHKIEPGEGGPLIRTDHGIGYCFVALAPVPEAIPAARGRSSLSRLVPHVQRYHPWIGQTESATHLQALNASNRRAA
jgi:two-component system KDP operon response regulator KdpE